MLVHPWQALKLVSETMPFQNGKDTDVQAFFSECSYAILVIRKPNK